MNKSKLIVCPNEVKMKILDNYSNDSKLHNTKFMSKEEFIKNYYFSYDELAIQYLMDKYNYNLDVCRVYLDNLYPIDIDKEYKSDKLNFLKNLKLELIDNNLLYFNKPFLEYIKNFDIEVKNYYDLDLYEEKALNYKVELSDVDASFDVVECNTLEEEVNDVCLNILKLLDSGVDINKIYLSNVSDEYLYTIKKLFKYYNIPINLDMNYSIYSTKIVRDYLDTYDLDLENKDNYNINKKLVDVVSSLARLDQSHDSYKKILTYKLKNTKSSSSNLVNAVRVCDIYKSSFDSDEYVFVLGFNQDVLPKMEKDVSYINDSIKEEVDLYTTNYKNKRNKKALIYILSNINNLHISYKLSSPFNSYYPSSLINDLGLRVISPITDSFKYSNIYNELRLGEKLDLYYKYGEKDLELTTLNNHYDTKYNTYSNSFTGIDNNIYLSSINRPLNLSYSTLNDYSECSFKYYLKNVLHLSLYTEMFPNFIGNMYHRILSLYKKSNFDFEKEYNEYINSRELSLKERVLLVKIKKDLEELIASLKKQQLLTGYDNEYLEKKLEVELSNKRASVIFKGFVDKIMYRSEMGEIYYSIIDYKSGYIDTNIEPMKYGLHMQLPVYLYLIRYSNIFSKSRFCGIYYQNILFNYPTCNNYLEYEKTLHDRLKLQGYSTDNIDVLEKFDSTYSKSEYIKSMNYSEDKGFGPYTKIINDTLLDQMIEYTKNYIDTTTDKILDGDFSINPKYYNGENISCKFCEFKDICFMREANLEYLAKVDDLSFLGGDE